MTRALTIFFLVIAFCSFSQTEQLEFHLKKYFADLPMLQSSDSIIHYAQSDTIPHHHVSRYKIQFYPFDTAAPAVRIPELELYSFYKEVNSVYDYSTRIFYRSYYDTVSSAYWGISTATRKLRTAKRHYKKLVHEFAGCFQKTSSEGGESGMMGGVYESTYFYLNKDDKDPVMEITWHSAADMSPNAYEIFINKKD